MDYKDKYIKYKTKYLELKNIDVNNQIGGNDDILIRGGGETRRKNKLKNVQ
jgi:hypothetical protein